MSISTPHDSGSESDTVRAKIVGNSYVQINRIESSVSWSDTIHAVNWFNTRSMLVYNFYNLIAGRSVLNVGGEPLFKGRLVRSLMGNEKDSRSVLLLVRYPSPLHFRSMLENTYFKIVSLFRTMAVRDFTFCLSKVVDTPVLTSFASDSHCYMVHLFRGNMNAIERVREVADDASVELVFSSMKSHSLVSGTGNGPVTPVPDVMDGILLFRATHESTLEQFLESDDYQKVIDVTDSSFVGLLHRLM